MDKYEFNIKVEQIKKEVKNGEYREAMAIADGIDWRRVNSVNLLSIVSDVYEKNRDYTEAKEILKLAYEKAPIGRRLLYKLALLSLKEGNVQEAESYYNDFYDLAPDDSRQYILRYLILKAKGAAKSQLINSLEQYNNEELDEHWMYELAELYFEDGRVEDSVALCDKIMLMFGIGAYVDKAIDLKANRIGRPLTDYQQSLLVNRDKYEKSIKKTGSGEEYDPDEDAYQTDDDTDSNAVKVVAAATAVEPVEETIEEKIEEKTEEKTEDTKSNKTGDDDMTVYTVNFIVERRSDEEGVEASVKLLKLMHEHTGSKNKVAKIKAAKLNELGMRTAREKLADKDLIVEQAGDLTFDTIEGIINLIKDEPEKRVVILIDNPMQIRKLLTAYPELTTLFHVDKEEREEKKPVSAKEKVSENEGSKPEGNVSKKVEEKRSAEPADMGVKTSKEIAMEKKMNEEEMDSEDFASYAEKYAESIDCSISGKSKLALYERIEIMEEDGIPLTRENAIALIEEAADAAEKPSFGQKLSGMFQQKYDKEDRLILREEHFIRR